MTEPQEYIKCAICDNAPSISGVKLKGERMEACRNCGPKMRSMFILTDEYPISAYAEILQGNHFSLKKSLLELKVRMSNVEDVEKQNAA